MIDLEFPLVADRGNFSILDQNNWGLALRFLGW